MTTGPIKAGNSGVNKVHRKESGGHEKQDTSLRELYPTRYILRMNGNAYCQKH